ncbi:segregation and condensation protein A [Flaviflagellibacter deserti]|uniref:Segregation and condensation protein A n=1 Tax=Flaviflagellibacter deserti TaxID=2267266 RepID=A0ABV9Z5X6_9HYPH
MAAHEQEPEFEADGPGIGERAFVVDLDVFEGPLDLLLDLARRDKVDLARMSIATLAEQYLKFIEEARKLRLELAADYLVMAAWLAYLKSRLLLPAPPKGDEPSGEEMAAALAHRLRRLEAMRKVSEQLASRDRLGRDIFRRGAPEGVRIERKSLWDASLYDLLSAYARQRSTHALSHVTIRRQPVWPLAEARAALERLVGKIAEWTALDAILLAYLAPPEEHKTVLASSFSASLEMAKEGHVQLRQERPFAPLFLRAKDAGGGSV